MIICISNDIAVDFPVETTYPIDPRNNPKAVGLEMIPLKIWASPNVRKVKLSKQRLRLSKEHRDKQNSPINAHSTNQDFLYVLARSRAGAVITCTDEVS